MPRCERLRRRGAPRLLGALVVAAVVPGCASDQEGGPMVDRIDDAIAAVESHYETPQDYYEISATERVVSLIVAAGDGEAAEQAFWSPEDALVEPVPVEPVDRPTFRSGDLDFRPDRMLSHIREELPRSEIVDFAITGAADGVVVYDARLRSEQGGVLLVLLDGDGRILGAQGE